MSKPKAKQWRRIRRKRKRLYGHPKYDDWAGRKPNRSIRRRYRWALEDGEPMGRACRTKHRRFGGKPHEVRMLTTEEWLDEYLQKHYGHYDGEQKCGEYAYYDASYGDYKPQKTQK